MRMIMLKRRETVTFLGDFGVGVWVWVWVLGVVLVVLFSSSPPSIFSHSMLPSSTHPSFSISSPYSSLSL